MLTEESRAEVAVLNTSNNTLSFAMKYINRKILPTFMDFIATQHVRLSSIKGPNRA